MRSVPKFIGQIKVGRPRTHSCLNVSGTGYGDVSGTGYGDVSGTGYGDVSGTGYGGIIVVLT
jgi:hypothetical protein